jgi:hypothetical protein
MGMVPLGGHDPARQRADGLGVHAPTCAERVASLRRPAVARPGPGASGAGGVGVVAGGAREEGEGGEQSRRKGGETQGEPPGKAAILSTDGAERPARSRAAPKRPGQKRQSAGFSPGTLGRVRKTMSAAPLHDAAGDQGRVADDEIGGAHLTTPTTGRGPLPSSRSAGLHLSM